MHPPPLLFPIPLPPYGTVVAYSAGQVFLFFFSLFFRVYVRGCVSHFQSDCLYRSVIFRQFSSSLLRYGDVLLQYGGFFFFKKIKWRFHNCGNTAPIQQFIKKNNNIFFRRDVFFCFCFFLYLWSDDLSTSKQGHLSSCSPCFISGKAVL